MTTIDVNLHILSHPKLPAGEILLSVVDAFEVYEMQEFYVREHDKFTRSRLRVLNLLAASAASCFVDDSLSQKSQEGWRQKALEYIGRADNIDANCAMTWLCKVIFWIGLHHQDPSALSNAAYYARLAHDVKRECQRVLRTV